MPLADGIYPLLDAFQNTQLSNNYEVRELNGSAGGAGYVPVTQTCARNDDDVSPIVQMSFGSRCNDKLTASYYSCPTFCDFNVTAAAGGGGAGHMYMLLATS